ncbi:MAG: nicotinate (nicotinamide) nucleotide adenylyltransferase [Actinobacteria bacterium]|nr:nicotinate (nicotinamide) nucleotide adenylyltransferase [Actinomycetota bacterium]
MSLQSGDATRGGPERIGIFGGTFDPPHIEHLLAAAEARSQLGLDRVLLVVANRPWQKIGTRVVTEAAIRLEMVEAAVESVRGLQAGDLEIRRGGASYTVDTLVELRRSHPDAELFVIVGADVEALIHTWQDAERVRSLATLVVVTRGGQGGSAGPEDARGSWRSIQRIEIPRLDVSGTELRERVAAGRNVDVLCPPGVVDVIEGRGLYRVAKP